MIIQVVRFAMIKGVYSTELEVEQFQTDHKPDGTNEGGEEGTSFKTDLLCAGCDGVLTDRYVFKASERLWHYDCLRCVECKMKLQEKCFFRDGDPLCQKDYFRRHGTKCAVCEVGIAPSEVVQRALGRVYHLSCFTCLVCHRELSTGDKFYLTEQGKVLCKDDYEMNSKATDEDFLTDLPSAENWKTKRARTFIDTRQLNALKSAYDICPRPAYAERERISLLTGLDMRVVQVWFQNRRAKDKRQFHKANPTWLQQKHEPEKRKPNHQRAHTWSPGTLALSLDLLGSGVSQLEEAHSQESLLGEFEGLYLENKDDNRQLYNMAASSESARLCPNTTRLSSFTLPYPEMGEQQKKWPAVENEVMQPSNLQHGFPYSSPQARFDEAINEEPIMTLAAPFPANDGRFLLNMETSPALHNQETTVAPKPFSDGSSHPDSFQPRHFTVCQDPQSKTEPEHME